MNRLESYKLPTGIALALRTNRPELMGYGGNVFTAEEQKEILRLLHDLIADRDNVARLVEELRQAVAMTAQTSRGQLAKLEDLMEKTVEACV